VRRLQPPHVVPRLRRPNPSRVQRPDVASYRQKNQYSSASSTVAATIPNVSAARMSRLVCA
jgi:hypothetical protein